MQIPFDENSLILNRKTARMKNSDTSRSRKINERSSNNNSKLQNYNEN